MNRLGTKQEELTGRVLKRDVPWPGSRLMRMRWEGRGAQQKARLIN